MSANALRTDYRLDSQRFSQSANGLLRSLPVAARGAVWWEKGIPPKELSQDEILSQLFPEDGDETLLYHTLQ